MIFGQEIDRLNLVIKEISTKYELAEKMINDYEARYLNATNELSRLQARPSTRDDSELLRRVVEL